MTAEDIAKLQFQRIDGNKPTPLNIWQPLATFQSNVESVAPTICLQNAEMNISNSKGKWKLLSWKNIIEMSEINLFLDDIHHQCCPLVNKQKCDSTLTIKELYVRLGCHFIITCFNGFTN